MLMVDFVVCSPPISGGRCILLLHFQLPIMLLSFDISGAGFMDGAASAAGPFFAGDFSCANAAGIAVAKASANSETKSFVRYCRQQCIAMLLPLEKMASLQARIEDAMQVYPATLSENWTLARRLQGVLISVS